MTIFAGVFAGVTDDESAPILTEFEFDFNESSSSASPNSIMRSRSDIPVLSLLFEVTGD